MARTLQAELDQIAEHADTTTRKGLHYILTGMGSSSGMLCMISC
jgi:uncharacterized membrane protein